MKEIWHNAFHELLKKNAGPVEDALAAMAPVLSGSDIAKIREEALKQSELVTSIGEAVKVSRRIGKNQLNIPLNPEVGRQADDGQGWPRRRSRSADLKITIIGPTQTELTKLREEWNTWLRSAKGKEQLRKIQDTARSDEERMGASEFDGLMASLRLRGRVLRRSRQGDRPEPGVAHPAGRGGTTVAPAHRRRDRRADRRRPEGARAGSTAAAPSRWTC